MDRRMNTHTIPQGQYTLPIYAARSWVGSHYTLESDEGYYSANPDDYWYLHDSVHMNARLWRVDHLTRTWDSRYVTTSRLLTYDATVGDLRRLARAACCRVVSS